MEVIFAILLTALGLYGGMFFIWKGDHHSNFDEAVFILHQQIDSKERPEAGNIKTCVKH